MAWRDEFANKPGAGKPGIAFRFTIEHYWPGLPGPERSTAFVIMRLVFMFLLVWFIGHEAQATKIASKKLSELVAESDHILICKVLNVQMLDANGNELQDREARTGPEGGNELRLHVVLEKDGVLKTNTKKVPTKFVIPLWPGWHDNLGNRRDRTEGKVFIFLLKEKDNAFQLVYPSGCQLRLSNKPEIEKILRPELQSANPNAGSLDSANTKALSDAIHVLVKEWHIRQLGGLPPEKSWARKQIDEDMAKFLDHVLKRITPALKETDCLKDGIPNDSRNLAAMKRLRAEFVGLEETTPIFTTIALSKIDALGYTSGWPLCAIRLVAETYLPQAQGEAKRRADQQEKR